jgi:hypothetical protein
VDRFHSDLLCGVVRSIQPFDHEGGTLTFTPSADGTHVDSQTSCTHPAHAGGKLKANGGGQPSAAPLELPNRPRWLREGTGRLATDARWKMLGAVGECSRLTCPGRAADTREVMIS